MTILEAIQEASADADFKGLSFANLQEFNSFMDSFEFMDYPRLIVVPYTTNGVFTNRKSKVIALSGWALKRIPEDTNDWRSLKLESDIIQPLRVMTEKFMTQLLSKDVTDSQVESVTYSITPEYMFLSAHLFGVSWRINWPVYGKLC